MPEDRQLEFRTATDDSLSRRIFVVAPLAVAAGLAGCAAAAQPGITQGKSLTASLTAEDKLDIQDLFTNYAWSYDCSDEETFLSNFLPDALVLGHGKPYQGKEAIRAWYHYLIEMRIQEGDDWLHHAYQHRFVGDSHRCIVYSYSTHFNSHPAAQKRGVRSTAYLVSECVKLNGTWFFHRHSIHRWDSQQLPWKKPLPWQTSSV